MGISGSVAGVSVLIAALKIASSTSNTTPLTRNFLFGLAAVLLFPAPWTLGLSQSLTLRFILVWILTVLISSAPYQQPSLVYS